ncbi:MAG: NAD-dependent epimerase/dehydratase family protein [Candidatus Woesearchaeota archaeon]
MRKLKMKYFVTGGAGFIGSHIVDKLLSKRAQVVVYDNFRTGNIEFIKENIKNPNFKLIRGDILNLNTLTKAMKGSDFIFHLAANADVKGGINNTKVDLDINTIGTWNVLEAMRINGIKKIAFSSSAAVYGEPKVFPTPENAELIQTSLYGASKLAGEAMIEAYCNYYNMQAWIFRFTSWIGERYTHGVIFDFVKKLKKNQKELQILGDGSQKKSFLYIKDGVEGIFKGIESFKEKVNILNVGHEEYLTVNKVADIVISEMGLKKVKRRYTGGKRGWPGDSPFVHLDISKLRKAGWKPEVSIEEGIRRTVRYLTEHQDLIKVYK